MALTVIMTVSDWLFDIVVGSGAFVSELVSATTVLDSGYGCDWLFGIRVGCGGFCRRVGERNHSTGLCDLGCLVVC